MLTTFVAHRANRLSSFISNKRNGGKAQSEAGGKKEPFIDEYLSHLAWFIGFDEGRKRYVTGMVKKFSTMIIHTKPGRYCKRKFAAVFYQDIL